MSKKMNRHIKSVWAKHLRSDEYVQNFDVDPIGGGIPLRTSDNTWSVFGVLCNIHAQCFPEIAKDQKDATSYLGYYFFLPHEVSVWAGLKTCPTFNVFIEFEEPVVIFGERYNSVEDLSLAGIPFFMIADIIEEKL